MFTFPLTSDLITKYAVWVNKKTCEAYAHEFGAGKIKVIVVQNAMFMDPWESSFAVSTSSLIRTLPVPADLPIIYTRPPYIGYNVDRLPVLGIEKAHTAPDRVLVRGDDKTVHQPAETIANATGKELKIVAALGQSSRLTCAARTSRPTWCDLCVMATVSHNERVNPGESLWEWI